MTFITFILSCSSENTIVLDHVYRDFDQLKNRNVLVANAPGILGRSVDTRFSCNNNFGSGCFAAVSTADQFL